MDPDAPEAPGAESAPPVAEAPGPEAAWAEVLARWGEEAAHRAFLARHPDLESLAEAGRRYREVLEQRPDDEVARRWRDEVLKKATVLAMAQLPRTPPPPPPGRLRRVLAAVLGAVAIGAVAWLAANFSAVVGALRGPGSSP